MDGDENNSIYGTGSKEDFMPYRCPISAGILAAILLISGCRVGDHDGRTVATYSSGIQASPGDSETISLKANGRFSQTVTSHIQNRLIELRHDGTWQVVSANGSVLAVSHLSGSIAPTASIRLRSMLVYHVFREASAQKYIIGDRTIPVTAFTITRP